MKNLSLVLLSAMLLATSPALVAQRNPSNHRNLSGSSSTNGKGGNSSQRTVKNKSSSQATSSDYQKQASSDQSVETEVSRLSERYDLTDIQTQQVRTAANIYYSVKLDPKATSSQKDQAKSVYDNKIKDITSGAKKKGSDTGDSSNSGKKGDKSSGKKGK